MSKLATFLSELSDRELAAFYHFRFTEFMKGSQEKILAELETRSMEIESISTYLKRDELDTFRIMENNLCPRCMSSKFYTSHEVETMTYSYATVDLKVDYRTCLVCHYSQDKVEGESTGFVGPIGFIRKLVNRQK